MSENLIEQFKDAVVNFYIEDQEKFISNYPEYTSTAEDLKRFRQNPSFYLAFGQIDLITSFPTVGGEFVCVDETGGNEGEGEYTHKVFQLNDRFIKITGTYTSWDGTDWEYGTVLEVFPREVTVVRYFKEKE